MDSNNYSKRINAWEQLKTMGKQIDTLAQSTMIKEIICMFAAKEQFDTCEQIITFFRGKISDEDMADIDSLLEGEKTMYERISDTLEKLILEILKEKNISTSKIANMQSTQWDAIVEAIVDLFDALIEQNQ